MQGCIYMVIHKKKQHKLAHETNEKQTNRQCPEMIKHCNRAPARLVIDEEMLRGPNERYMSGTELKTV